MKYTRVDVDHVGLEERYQVEEWVNAEGQQIPLLAKIADPILDYSWTWRRSPTAMDSAKKSMQFLLVAQKEGSPRLSLLQMLISVVRAGQPPIPNCFRFAEMAHAEIVRS